MQAIADNAAEPTFENTLVAMEKTGELFNRAIGRIQRPSLARTAILNCKKYRIIEAPKLAAQHDAIYPRLQAV